MGFDDGEGVGFDNGTGVGSTVGIFVGVATFIVVTSLVGLDVVGRLEGVLLSQAFTTMHVSPLPDSFPVDMVSLSSLGHLRMNFIWTLVLLLKSARVDISQQDSKPEVKDIHKR